MRFLIVAAGALWLLPYLPAQAQTTRAVNPEFHPLKAETDGPKRSWKPVQKASTIAAPIRHESRALVDHEGELTLSCDEIDVTTEKSHNHD